MQTRYEDSMSMVFMTDDNGNEWTRPYTQVEMQLVRDRQEAEQANLEQLRTDAANAIAGNDTIGPMLQPHLDLMQTYIDDQSTEVPLETLLQVFKAMANTVHTLLQIQVADTNQQTGIIRVVLNIAETENGD